MIERLEAYKERINTNYAVPFTTAIFDIVRSPAGHVAIGASANYINPVITKPIF